MREFRLQVSRLEARDAPSAGYFRFASYNISASDRAPAAGLDTILQAIGAEPIGGLTQPLDLIALQEVESQATTAQTVANLMNAVYGAGVYGRGSLNGLSNGSGTQGIVYNTQTLQLLSEAAIGTVSTSGAPRQTMRYKLHPIGYSSAADFYVYVSHFKANDTPTDADRRLVEATAIRADADALGDGVQVLFVGDFNLYRASEPAYQKLLSTGNGQAFDPINRPGEWHGLSQFRDIFTQAPAVNPPGGLTGGGLNDRFDFQLVSNELTDGAGIDYVAGSYRAFGNNGSVPVNGSINSPGNTALMSLPNRQQVLDLLTTVTDHLPVVADFRIVGPPPAVANVQIDDGTAQRSRVAQLRVTFSTIVSFAGSPSTAFNLQKIVGGAPAGAVGFNVATAVVAGRTEATFSFTSDTFGGSLIDGRYRLTVVANQVLAGGLTMTADAVANFHRMFGDANGDARVDIADFGLFSTSYGLTAGQPGYLAYFDYNGDGRVDIADFGQFSVRYFTTLP